MKQYQEHKLSIYQSHGYVFDITKDNVVIVMQKTLSTITFEEKYTIKSKNDKIFHADKLHVVDFIDIDDKEIYDQYNHNGIIYIKNQIVSAIAFGPKHSSCYCSHWNNVDMYSGVIYYKSYNDVLTGVKLDIRPCYDKT